MNPTNDSNSPKNALVDVQQIPEPYRDIFASYPSFNVVQSVLFHDVLYTDNSIALSAPTGSGKTAIFELAIVRQLISIDSSRYSDIFKMVYISPMKALCEERLIDWHKKFSPYGVNCISITGDSDSIDIRSLSNHNLIITTPEKWDSITRKWKENRKFIQVIKLLMIDEIHLLNEEHRGATLEALICRMKTIQNSIPDENEEDEIYLKQNIRFLAVSATFPNIRNIGEWLGGAKYFSFDTSIRPVKLNTMVLGYNYSPTSTPFKFDIMLNYKLPALIIKYSNGKPTLIFCSTRKSVEMAAKQLSQTLTIPLNADQKDVLLKAASSITDSKLKSIMIHGIGYHHGGLLAESRNVIEQLFRAGGLPVLLTTSTLATGVNLPAHLVIIKSTKFYDKGGFQDYTATAVLQMIGRAGRPQFDTEATALILTPSSDREKFTKIIDETQDIESNLHRHLTEHLNAEIVLRTITDLDVAMRWLSSTFLYIRARENPKHYGFGVGLSSEKIDKKLLEVCQIDLNKLVKAGMATMDEDTNINPTSLGVLMAKFYMSFESMKLFKTMNGFEILQQVLGLISKCQEFSDMRLRVDEKKCLNLLNKNKNKNSIRFPFNGKIKTLDMKINCTIQAVFGCLEIEDHSILTEAFRIMRLGEKICRCLIEYLETRGNCYAALLNSTILWKCFRVQLWENSPHIAKQFPGIGSVTSSQLMNAGKTTLEDLMKMNPRDIEMITKKKPPFGNKLIEMAESIPRYQMILEKIMEDGALMLKITITFLNPECLKGTSFINCDSIMCLIVGDNCNNILLYERYMHSYILENSQVVRFLAINTYSGKVKDVYAHFLSENIVGIDLNETFQLEHQREQIPKLTIDKPNLEEAKKDDSTKKSFKKLTGDYANLVQTYMDNYLKCKKKIPDRNERELKNANENTSITKNNKYESFNKSPEPHKVLEEKGNDNQRLSIDPKPENFYNLSIFEKSFNVPGEKTDIVINEKDINRVLSCSVGTLTDEELSEHIDTFLSREQKENETNNENLDLEKKTGGNVEFLDSDVASHLPKLYSKYGMERNDFEEKGVTKSPGIIKKQGILSKSPKNFRRFPSGKGKFQSAQSFESSVFSSKTDSLKKFRFEPTKRFAHGGQKDDAPSTRNKLRKSENADVSAFEEENNFLEPNGKSITWRSPLVYSPPMKFSPTPLSSSFSFTIPMPKNNDSDSLHDWSSNTLDTSTSSKNQKVSSTVDQRDEEKQPRSKTPIRGTKFSLADKEYANLSKNSNESMNNSHGSSNNFYAPTRRSLQYHDIMSASFLEDFGMTDKPKTINTTAQDFAQKGRKNIDSRISVGNYYHNLVAKNPKAQNKTIIPQIPDSRPDQIPFYLNQDVNYPENDLNTSVISINRERTDLNQSLNQINMQQIYPATTPHYFNRSYPTSQIRPDNFNYDYSNVSQYSQPYPVYSPNYNQPIGYNIIQNPSNPIYYNQQMMGGPSFHNQIYNHSSNEPKNSITPGLDEEHINNRGTKYWMPRPNPQFSQIMIDEKRLNFNNQICDSNILENVDTNITIKENEITQQMMPKCGTQNTELMNQGFFLNTNQFSPNSAPGFVCSNHRVLNCNYCPFFPNYARNYNQQTINSPFFNQNYEPLCGFNNFPNYQGFGPGHNNALNFTMQQRQMQERYVQTDILNNPKNQMYINAENICEKRDNQEFVDGERIHQYYLMKKYFNSFENSEERK